MYENVTDLGIVLIEIEKLEKEIEIFEDQKNKENLEYLKNLKNDLLNWKKQLNRLNKR